MSAAHPTRLAARLLRRQRPVTVLLLAVTGLAALLALRVEFANAIEIWFPQDAPEMAVYRAFSSRFPADETLLMVVFAEDVFAPPVRAALRHVAAAAVRAPHVHRVRSLDDPALRPPEADPGSPLQRDQALANGVVNGWLVTADARAAAVVVELERAGNTVSGKRALVAYLDGVLREVTAATGTTWRMTGTPALDARVLEINQRDLRLLLPVAVLLLVTLGSLLLGSLWLGLLPVATVLLAATWAYGCMGLFGLHTTLLSTALVPLLLAVGSADALHLVMAVRRELAAGRSVGEAVEHGLGRLLKPCFFTSATTAAGLCAMLASELGPVREFGVVAAVGVGAAFVFSITLLPYLLLRLPPRLLAAGQHGGPGALPARAARAVAAAPGLGRAGVAAALLLAALAAAQLLQLRATVEPLAWLGPDDPLRRATEQVDTAFAGSASLEFLVSVEHGTLRDLAALRALEAFQGWLEQATAVTRTLSVVDLLAEATRQARAAPAGSRELPRSQMLANLLLDELQRRGALDGWTADGLTSARLTARVPLSGTHDLVAQLAGIEREAARRFGAGALRVQPTGYSRLMVAMEGDLLAAQARSLVAAFVVVTLLLGMLLGTLTLALYAVVPSVLPVLAGLGLLALTGTPLDPGTVMAGAVTLGLVVDDTVHFLVAFRARLEAGMAVDPAVLETLRESGPPIIATSVMVALGFSVLLLAGLAPTARFGALSAGIALLALAAVLWLLPGLLRLAPRRLLGRMPVARQE